MAGMRLLLVAGFTVVSSAQNPFGRITGQVVDPAGATVVGAKVRVIQSETNITAAAVTSASGVYDFPALLPGNYRISVEVVGFKTSERGPVEVRVADVLRLDFTLQLGSQQETITVTGEAPLLESENASVGQLLDNRAINQMPLGGRSLTYLMQTAPGVITTSPPMHGWLPQARGFVSSMASAGTATNVNEFSLDGTPNQDTGGTIMFVPPPEMIQEVRVQTAAYDASSGHHAGSRVDMVVKAGTNEYHANLFYSNVNRQLMSNPFFVNRALYDAASGPPTKQKRDALFPYNMTARYRGSLHGPIIIPKLYNGRNRTFFSYGYERMLRRTPSSGPVTIPTMPERTGDFSALLAVGPQYQIYDPQTAAAAPGGRVSRTPLPVNRIPSARLDPIAQQLLRYYPEPNTTGTADGISNYFSALSDSITFASHMLRVDQVISDKQRLYATFSTFWVYADQGRTFRNDGVGGLQDNRNFNIVVDDVITLRPDTVVDLRYGVAQFRPTGAPVSAGTDLAALGFSPSLLNQIGPAYSALPSIGIEGYASLNGSTYSKSGKYFHTLAGSVAHTRGAHTLRMGSEFRVFQINTTNPGMVVPSYSFGTNWTRGPLDSSAASPIGQGLASFLLGLPTGGFADRNDSFAETSRFMGIYFQDDWKVAANLTINAGLRYEVEWPTTERFNRANRAFDFSVSNPIEPAAQANYAANPIPELPASAFRTPGGIEFAGVNGVPRGIWDSDRNNFLPRVGLAYRLRPKLVRRAGYGIFFESLGADRNDVLQQGFNQRTQIVPSLDNGITFQGTLANPFPNGLIQPTGAAGGLRTYLGNSLTFFPPGRRTGYAQRWSFVTQYELPRRILLEAGYMGTRGTKLGMSRNFAALPEQYLSKSPVRDQATINQLTSQVANPFFGLAEFNGTALQGRTVARQQLLSPIPHFTGVNGTISDGFSWYHAGHLRVEKRLARGYTLSGTYTWSKYMQATQTLNPSDFTPTHVISSADRPHHVAFTGTWDLPWAKTKLWGGWSLSAIYQWQTGSPIGFGNVIFNGNLADLVLPRSERRAERWFNTDAGFNRVAAQQLASNIRTFPLLLTGLRTHNWSIWDISVIKVFRIKERLRIELRGEAVDAFNTPIFSGPNTAPTNTQFGQVTNTIWSEQRKITVVGRLYW